MPSYPIHQALQQAEQTLLSSTSARLDAEVLLAHVLLKPRSYLHAWPERLLEDLQAFEYTALVARRAAGEPVAYLTGHREFWSLDLQVSPHTLIPRPETETLVEQALARIPSDASWRIADLGTGSGAIALAIASERPLAELVATDRCARALAMAKANAQRLKLHNIAFVQSDWDAAIISDTFDFIVSNPPYIAQEDPHLQQGDVRFEPREALVAGPQGMDDLHKIIEQAWRLLHPSACLLLEHGFTQGSDVREYLCTKGYTQVQTLTDAAGLERISLGNKG